MTEQTKQFLDNQVFPAGTRIPVSCIIYKGMESQFYCPYCGSFLKYDLAEKKYYCADDCKGFAKEQEELKKIKAAEDAALKAKETYENLRTALITKVRKIAYKKVAQEFLDGEEDRNNQYQAFKKELEDVCQEKN